MDAAGLAQALRAVRSGRQWKALCPCHEDRSPSMIIFDGRTGVVQVRCLAGCDQRDLIAALKARGLWDVKTESWNRTRGTDHVTTSPGDAYAKRTNVRPDVRAENLRGTVSHETQMTERARRVFDGAVLCHGTLGQLYLERREIWTAARDVEDIRYHPQCPRERGEQPAIVIAMRSITSRGVVAVQRIFLNAAGAKDGAMMMGPVGNAAMQLEPRGASRVLHVAEGCESGLAVMCMGHWPVWALGSCGAIERLALVDGVDALWIWADHDRVDVRTGRRPGVHAAMVCRDRWRDAGREVIERLPACEGQDPWDVWEGRNARQ